MTSRDLRMKVLQNQMEVMDGFKPTPSSFRMSDVPFSPKRVSFNESVSSVYYSCESDFEQVDANNNNSDAPDKKIPESSTTKRRSSLLTPKLLPSNNFYLSTIVRKSPRKLPPATSSSKCSTSSAPRVAKVIPRVIPTVQKRPIQQSKIPRSKTFPGHSQARESFNCQWCEKKFQKETALSNHLADHCTKIPVAEKRKVLAQRDKK
jgi:hypothetical protein